MSMVFPGVADVMASPLRPVGMLLRLDFPTLERPMKAYSGNVPPGHFLTSVLLMTNSALVISILLLVFLLFLHAKVALISKISVRNAEFSLFLERTGCIPVI